MYCVGEDGVCYVFDSSTGHLESVLQVADREVLWLCITCVFVCVCACGCVCRWGWGWGCVCVNEKERESKIVKESVCHCVLACMYIHT